MKHQNLNSIRLEFTTNRSVGGLKEEASSIFNLSENYVYLLCSDGCENPYDDELIQHKIDYYLDEMTYMPERDDNYQDYFNTDFIPNFDRIFSSSFYQKYNIPTDYTILKIYDVKTLNFFLSVDNDEEIHIFSSDYDISFLKTYLNEYYQNIKNYYSIKLSDYLLGKYRNYFISKTFIFYDTYEEDENHNYLFIGEMEYYDSIKEIKIIQEKEVGDLKKLSYCSATDNSITSLPKECKWLVDKDKLELDDNNIEYY